MRRIIGSFAFEDQDFSSVLEHAKRLEGNTLREIATLQQRPELLSRRGKGVAGQLLHAWFGIDENDSRSEPDLLDVKMPDGRYAGVEIKAVPLKSVRNGIRVKERCKVTSIEYGSLLEEQWLVSRARHKLLVTLFIYYRYAGAVNWAESTVERTFYWHLETSPARHTIESDWARTWHYVRDGRAHELSESQGAILGASTAGPGGSSKLVIQPANHSVKARKRAFSLKPPFLLTLYQYDANPAAYVSLPLQFQRPHLDVRDSIVKALSQHVGRTLGDIAEQLGVPSIAASGPKRPKHSAALLLKRMLGVVADKNVFEIEALGLTPKTIPICSKDMMPFEAMSFPVMKLADFAEETWEDSALREQLRNLLMIPLFRPARATDYRSSRLGMPFLWTPTGAEEISIRREWTMYQCQVRAGKAAYELIENRRVTKLTRYSETQFVHLRPKGPDGSCDDEYPAGVKTPQLCFWLNKSFVRTLLQRHSRHP